MLNTSWCRREIGSQARNPFNQSQHRLFTSSGFPQNFMIRRFLQAHQRDPCLHSSLHSSSQGAMNSTACHASQGSPIPYLLAGLAAMLALVAVSLFILACSYWKLVGCVDQYGVRTSASTATAAPQTNMIGMDPNSRGVEEETTKIVVIMAGQDKPTFLAQPING